MFVLLEVGAACVLTPAVELETSVPGAPVVTTVAAVVAVAADSSARGASRMAARLLPVLTRLATRDDVRLCAGGCVLGTGL